jgi:hypothetical protein
MTDFSMRNEPLYGTSSIIGITDIINEITTGVGVTVDGVLLKDGIVSTDTINEITTGSGVTIDGVLLKDSIVSTDTINEITTGSGVTVEGVLLKDSIVSTDIINEQSTGVGVTIDGVLLKDSIVSTDTINEQSVNTGVTIDGVLLKDSIVSTDTINEQSVNTGVTIDGVLLKDSIVSTDTINEQSVNTGVTIDGVLLKDSIVSTDTINEKSIGVGVTIDGVLSKDNEITVKKININDDTNLSVDTANTDISKWMAVTDTVGTTDYYVPLFTAADTALATALPYVPCSSWLNFSLTSGNDQNNDIVWEVTDNSIDGDIVFTTGTWNDITLVTGTYLVTASISFDITGSDFEEFLYAAFEKGGALIVNARSQIANVDATGTDYGSLSISYIGALTGGTDYSFRVITVNTALTYHSHGGIVRLA